MKNDFLSISDLSIKELKKVFELTRSIKKQPRKYKNYLSGKVLACIFEKQSLRTRVTFEVGIKQLGGESIYLAPADISLGKRESVYDVAKNLERWVDGIMIRTFGHNIVVEMADAAKIPIINGLTDLEHPCQAIADFYTVLEHKKKFKKLKFTYVGDGNNVCHSLMLTAAKLGVEFYAATPKGYEPSKEIFEKALEDAEKTGAIINIVNDPIEAVTKTDVVYTDVWASMGQESEAAKRKKIFKDYQVNSKLMSYAKSDAIFMHCLPAHRGEEVTDDVLDSKQSVVYDEAENRLHAQKAIMCLLMK
ncbi:MAG TPA: ornithine carbamoyltransferase [Bacteroidota bacterium]|nr:ornithine carbamoyltransferase [Bacteroidota bacterium]